MKLFIWTETLNTGAYHKDGSAGVIEETLEKARTLLKKYDLEHSKVPYVYGDPASEIDPDFEIGVLENEKPEIIFLEAGCDC